MECLILADECDAYRAALAPRFPAVTFHARRDLAAAADVAGQAEILVAFAFEVSTALLDAMPRLRWIQALTTGVDTILALPNLAPETRVTSMRGIHGPQMSEMALLLMLALNRDLPRLVRQQQAKLFQRYEGKLLQDKTVGIVGIGVSGIAIAEKCRAFGMTVIGISRTPREIPAIDRFHPRDALAEVAPELDYLVLALPLEDDSQALVDARVLAAMKPTAYLVNLARGGVVDEAALIVALQARAIAGAALDVVNEEPMPDDHPFWTLENVIYTPRVSGMVDVYTQQALPVVAGNLEQYLQGRPQQMINLVERGAA